VIEPPKPATPEKEAANGANGGSVANAKDAKSATNMNLCDEDPEAEKRRKRAERFGIPLVEPHKPRPPRAQAPQKRSPFDGPKKLEARAARFETVTAAQKRHAPTESIDVEEQEKRRKRAERFGIPPTGAKA